MTLLLLLVPPPALLQLPQHPLLEGRHEPPLMGLEASEGTVGGGARQQRLLLLLRKPSRLQQVQLLLLPLLPWFFAVSVKLVSLLST